MKINLQMIFSIFLNLGTINKVRHSLILAIALLTAFTTFRALQASDSDRLISTIGSILRNESLTANTYALSKSLSDIESLNLIDCAQVREINTSDRLFYDSSTNERCNIGSWLERLRIVSTEINSINGTSFLVTIQPRLDLSKIFLELLVYLFIVFSFWQIIKILQKNRQLAEARVKAVEIEKQIMRDHALQIRHDVASPLTAINTIVRLIPKMDPELKSILVLAIERTQSLFNELSKPATTTHSVDSFLQINEILTDITPLIDQVVAEKKSIWADSVEVIWVNSVQIVPHVYANRNELARILSNILNNAFEACDNHNDPKILIKTAQTPSHFSVEISDNGKGISIQNLSRIGQKGVSIGKEGHTTAGSGLGVYNAIQTLKQWSGELKISSIEDGGTTVTIVLKRA